MAYLLPYLPYPTSFAHTAYRLFLFLLLTVCLFIPVIVPVCSWCRGVRRRTAGISNKRNLLKYTQIHRAHNNGPYYKQTITHKQPWGNIGLNNEQVIGGLKPDKTRTRTKQMEK